MTTKLKAEEQNLDDIFSKKYLFKIPAYQRPYAWTVEQTGDLFGDLTIALSGVQATDKVQNAEPYFLGSIVLIKNDEQPEQSVVDGQQRLTTLTILLCVLRKVLKMSNYPLDHYIRDERNDAAGRDAQFRLTLRDRDRKFFMENIQDPNGMDNLLGPNPPKIENDSQQRLYENAKYLETAVSNLDSTKQQQLVQFLIQRCYLVVVSVPDESSAFRIFSVLNTRGLDLLPVDILKAEIFGGISGNDSDGYTVKWEDAEEEIGRDHFNELFSHIRMIFVKSKLKGTLVHEFRDGVMKFKRGSDLIDDVIIPYKNAYEVVSWAAYESADDAQSVNVYLRSLAALDNRDWVAPAIAFFKINEGNHDALAKFVKYLERLAYAMFILRHNVNMRISRYADVLRAIENPTKHDLSKSLELSAEEKNSVIETLGEPIYHTRICKPILLRLDSSLAGTTVIYEHSVVTIEHVLPRTADSVPQWVKSFPDEEQREEWTDKLANLVLLSRRKNSQAQNYDFDTKINKYFEIKKGGMSNFALTNQVILEKKWTPKTLEARQANLLDVLKKEWELG